MQSGGFVSVWLYRDRREETYHQVFRMGKHQEAFFGTTRSELIEQKSLFLPDSSRNLQIFGMTMHELLMTVRHEGNRNGYYWLARKLDDKYSCVL
ncbi:hypothetical protein BIU88_05610 [Chlorobaculum limnaeum]|uniref:Uncharacterized protein n=1 Tax=Chlorobaculum limnaeum TaxID=274537 RepID=A0A1D8D7Q9_CHLLM|nr:hypothetical protein BIU88_05610 [Chlorobaculum limnaeum]